MGEAGTRIGVYLGSPIEDPTERKFLARLRREFELTQTPVVVLANFHVGSRRRQIDFVVVTADHAVVVELKGYRLPVQGKPNGPWFSTQADGSLRQLGSRSPYDQTVNNRFAVTDALATFLADGADARPAASGMLCIFPEPPHGSRIPASDHKASIGGWSVFERLIASRCSRTLPLDRWREFAEELGLRPESEVSPSSSSTLIADYQARLIELSAAIDGPFHPPTFEVDHEEDQPEIEVLIKDGRQPLLMGPSGVGKTRLFAKLAASAANAGRVPVTIRAREFEGDLAPLLRKSVAVGTPVSPGSLFSAARAAGADIVLLVDALNECSPALLPRLVSVLQAFRLRYDALVLLSGQSDVELPPLLDGPRLKLLVPDRERAEALVAAHLGRPLDAAEREALDLVATSQDAAVLAGILSETGYADGRYRLYDLFTRNLLPREKQAALHAGLAALATAIRAELRPMIATASARRILRQACHDCDHDVVEAVLTDGKLLSTEGGQTRFRHDLFTDFFAAADLIHSATSEDALITEVLRPYHAELREFVLGGAGRAVQAALLSSEAAPRLLPGALRGRGGRELRRQTLVRCQELLDRVATHIRSLVFSLPEQPETERYQYLKAEFDGELGLADHENRLWHALPVAAEEGLLNAILEFAQAVDHQIGNEVARLRLEYPDIRYFNHLAYLTIHGAWCSASELSLVRSLVTGCQNRFGDLEPVDLPGHLADELDSFEGKGPTQLLILLAMMRGCWRQMPKLPTRMVELLSHCWESRVYHLRLLTTDMVYFNGRHFEPDLKAEVAELLHSYLGENALQNTFVFDALKAIDAVDFGLDVDAIVEEYVWIAEQPINDAISKRAMSAYYSTWDHPDPEPYCEAFYERLTDEVRGAVLIRALSSADHDTMSLDFAMRELPEPLAEAWIPIVERYVVAPVTPSISVQSSVALFAAACAKLARSNLPLPPTASPEAITISELAWRRIGPIIYALNQEPARSREELEKLWAAFASTGGGAAVDPVFRTISDVPMFRTRAKVDFIDYFPSQMRSLALEALQAEYRPESYFHIYNEKGAEETLRDHRRFALSLLGSVGKSTDISLLRLWMDDAQLGEAALASARRLETRTI